MQPMAFLRAVTRKLADQSNARPLVQTDIPFPRSDGQRSHPGPETTLAQPTPVAYPN